MSPEKARRPGEGAPNESYPSHDEVQHEHVENSGASPQAQPAQPGGDPAPESATAPATGRELAVRPTAANDNASIREYRVTEASKAHDRGWALTPVNGKAPFHKEWQKAPSPTQTEDESWANSGASSRGPYLGNHRRAAVVPG